MFKNIHLGFLIKQRVLECGIDLKRICSFMKCTEEEIENMYESESLNSDILLRWSKLLKYDFFRMFSQHLILYSPPANTVKATTSLPNFRKNIYTKEIINFILEQIVNNEKTKKQVIEEYKIPRTTLYKWLSKYRETNQ